MILSLIRTKSFYIKPARMTEKYRVLVSDEFRKDPNSKRICEIFNVIWWDDYMSVPEKFQEKIQALFPVRYSLSETMVSSMPNLKVVTAYGVGVNHLNVGMCIRHGIKVGNTPDVLNDCTADHAMALLLAAARRLANGFDLLRNGEWIDCSYLGRRVTGATIGIVGMGRIGYKVAERALGFRMKVLYHNRNRRSEEEELKVNATYCAKLDDLLGQSDFVLVVMPLTEHTKGLIGAQQFEKMKQGAIIMNIGRGAIIDHDALVSALESGKLGGAGLDVTDPEPLPASHPLLHMPNVVVTPHVGSGTYETRQEMFDMAVGNITAAMENREMPNELRE